MIACVGSFVVLSYVYCIFSVFVSPGFDLVSHY